MKKSTNRSEYFKSYKKNHYNKTRKIITFPLFLEEFEQLKEEADKLEIKVNKLVKKIVLSYLKCEEYK